MKVNLLLLEYRGFGFSSGHPSEGGVYQDATAALTYLRTRPDVDHGRVVLFGRSLGERWGEVVLFGRSLSERAGGGLMGMLSWEYL